MFENVDPLDGVLRYLRALRLPGCPMRHPDKMFPCIESYGILVTDLAEKYQITFMNGGNVVTWFSLILYE